MAQLLMLMTKSESEYFLPFVCCLVFRVPKTQLIEQLFKCLAVVILALCQVCKVYLFVYVCLWLVIADINVCKFSLINKG